MKLPAKSSGFSKPLRLTLWLVGLCLITGLAITLTYLYFAQSNISGKRAIKSLGDSVAISFDESDIPHIHAKSQADAYFALGYLHASERSWQMEMNRRIASGRLSEILGADTIKIDRFVRTLGVKRAAERQFDRYPVSAKRLLQAYADGVNAGNAQLGCCLLYTSDAADD